MFFTKPSRISKLRASRDTRTCNQCTNRIAKVDRARRGEAKRKSSCHPDVFVYILCVCGVLVIQIEQIDHPPHPNSIPYQPSYIEDESTVR